MINKTKNKIKEKEALINIWKNDQVKEGKIDMRKMGLKWYIPSFLNSQIQWEYYDHFYDYS